MPADAPPLFPVEFVGEAATLPEPFRDARKPEIRAVALRLSPRDKLPRAVYVSQVFSGYTVDIASRVVFGVEIHYPTGIATHIVKLGTKAEVAPDFEGWEKCTAGRQVASRIFTPVQGFPLSDDTRWGVVYQDAYTLFGPNRSGRQSEPLDIVAGWSVMDASPDPISVERAIAHIFTDLNLWFYPDAVSNRPAAITFYRRHLGMGAEARSSKRVLDRWQSEEPRQDLRRDAVWALCGGDKPNADLRKAPPRYLDPIEFVAWCLAAHPPADGASGEWQPEHPDWAPDTLVGRAHGDLHARNVLVGVRRGEADYPAVFDYGEMAPDNVLAWDFVKLETELKRRLLPQVLLGPESDASGWLLTKSRLRPKAAVGGRGESMASERANRLRCFLAFEEVLHDLTTRILSRQEAEWLGPFPTPPTPVPTLNRLLALLLRIRKEAAICLGFGRTGRRHLWQDEYDFALAVYGLLNAKWDYEDPQIEAALVSAGVAAARMPSTPGRLQNEIVRAASGSDRAGRFPSYRVPLAVIHALWADRQYDSALAYVETCVLAPVAESSTGRIVRLDVRLGAIHAIPLLGEAALIEVEVGRVQLAEPLLSRFRPLAREFGDFETLGRIGRLFKDMGDRRWQRSNTPPERFRGSDPWQFYRNALTVYQEAFAAVPDDYYTGINAATLAALTGDMEEAARLAEAVARICQSMSEISWSDRYWVFATQGEAAILLGQTEEAVRFFATAIGELGPDQGGMANSTYKQLRRLHRGFGEPGEARVGPVLKVFEESAFAHTLTDPFTDPVV